jgi:hypothetical protein
MEAVRWHRRSSRERAARTALGPAIAAGLEALRGVHRPDELRARYLAAAGAWGCCLPLDAHPTPAGPVDVRRAEDAAFGLRWLELAADIRVDACRSLVPQLHQRLLSGTAVHAL